MELYQVDDCRSRKPGSGEQLEAGLGSALPQSIQLWVHSSDATRASAAIARMEGERRQKPIDRASHERPKSAAKLHRQPARGCAPHYDPDPRSSATLTCHINCNLRHIRPRWRMHNCSTYRPLSRSTPLLGGDPLHVQSHLKLTLSLVRSSITRERAGQRGAAKERLRLELMLLHPPKDAIQ